MERYVYQNQTKPVTIVVRVNIAQNLLICFFLSYNTKTPYLCWVITSRCGRKEGNVFFNDALNAFYLRLYGVRHMVKDHSDSERGNPLTPHGLLFPISSMGSFICTTPQTG